MLALPDFFNPDIISNATAILATVAAYLAIPIFVAICLHQTVTYEMKQKKDYIDTLISEHTDIDHTDIDKRIRYAHYLQDRLKKIFEEQMELIGTYNNNLSRIYKELNRTDMQETFKQEIKRNTAKLRKHRAELSLLSLLSSHTHAQNDVTAAFNALTNGEYGDIDTIEFIEGLHRDGLLTGIPEDKIKKGLEALKEYLYSKKHPSDS